MIITRTPFRISFVGGGSDLAAFYERSKGAVLSTTIDKYMYISSHQFFEPDKIRVKYSKTETVNSISELDHPILREALTMLDIEGGIEVSSIADVPAGTGMGSSSSFTVGLLHNLHAAKGIMVNKEKLAQGACEIEIEKLGEPIGKQDQYAAAYGGLNVIEFLENGNVNVDPLHLRQETYDALQENLLMFYIGNQRKASDILSEQKKNSQQEDKFKALQRMVELVYELKSALYNNDLNAFGQLMHENWLLKKELAKHVSNEDINDLYDLALKNGATGGKLLGAGGGGFLLFYCEKAKQEGLINALNKVRKFRFAFDQEGSKLIYYG